MNFFGFPDLTMLAVICSRFSTQLLRRKKSDDIFLPELGEKFVAPGVDSPVFNGFVTSSNNKDGLNLQFHHDVNGGVSCEWEALSKFEGYPQTLHGGISFAILDEMLAYSIFDKYKTYAVTLSSNTQWLGKVKIGSKIKSKAYVKKRFWRFVKVKGEIYNHRGRVVVSMNSVFYMPTRSEFKRLVDLSIMPEEVHKYCGVD